MEATCILVTPGWVCQALVNAAIAIETIHAPTRSLQEPLSSPLPASFAQSEPALLSPSLHSTPLVRRLTLTQWDAAAAERRNQLWATRLVPLSRVAMSAMTVAGSLP